MATFATQPEGVERIRLNISAQVSDEVVSRFLVVVETKDGMDRLVDKVQRRLRQGGIKATVERVLNSFSSILPNDEELGDLLRDGEELIVELRGQDGRLLRTPSADNSFVKTSPRAAPTTQSVKPTAQVPACVTASGDGTLQIHLTAPPQWQDDESEEEEEQVGPPQPIVANYPPSAVSLPGALGSTQMIPGPSESLSIDTLPHDTMKVDHPCKPIQPVTYDNDWLVECLTPQLREFVMDHYQELTTEPTYVASIGKFVGPRFYQKSGCFVTIFMRPQVTLGSDAGMTMPVHYNITKHELLRFQRQAEVQVQKTQRHLEWFSKAMNGLQGLLQKGMSETDQISDMLPHSYAVEEEVEGVMMEVDRPLFPKIEGLHPIIIIDSSGPAMNQHITFVKAALKRAIFAHMGSKSSFQLVRFNAAGGEPRLWMKGMVPVADHTITLAEEWIDNLVPVSSARLVHAVRYAMAHQDCDRIYIVSSGACVDKIEHDMALKSIKELNTRHVPIDTVGIEANHLGELLLRRIAESNHGDITLKCFDGCSAAPGDGGGGWSSWRTNLVNEKSKQLSDNFKKPKMSIGSQVRIIEVMQKEERKKEESWIEEWKCTQRLLDTTESAKKSGSVMGDRDMVKEMERKHSRTISKRVAGGYKYETEKPDFSLERMFEHQSAVQWTANADTEATGPKVPRSSAGQHRVPKFPPSSEHLPEALTSSATEIPKQQARPRSAGMASTQGRQHLASTLPPTGSNPWGTTPGINAAVLERTRRAASRASSGTRKAGPLPALSARGNGPYIATYGSQTVSVRSTSVERRPPVPGSALRTASADKAAGEYAQMTYGTKTGTTRRPSSGHGRPQAPPLSARSKQAIPTTAPPENAPPAVVKRRSPFTLQRRWSF